MRRDLDIDCDPAQLVLDPPDRAQLKEIFRRFEFRNLLNRVDELDAAVPSAPMKVTGVEVPWREGELDFRGVVGYAVDGDRAAVATGDEVVIGPRPARVDGDLVVHDAKALARRRARRHAARRVSDRSGPRRRTSSTTSRPSTASSCCRRPPAEEETTALVRRAETPRRLVGPLLERLEERGVTDLYRDDRAAAHRVLAQMEQAGVKIDTYRMGEITARLADRVEELEAHAVRARGRGVHDRLDAAGRPRALRAARADRGAQGQDRATRPTRRCCARSAHEHAIVPVIEEWRELSKLLNTYLGPLPSLLSDVDGRLHTTFNQTVAATGRLSTSDPNLQSIPIRTELGREIRSAFVAEEGHRAAVGRLLADRAAHPRARLGRAEAARGVRARRGHPHGDGGRGARRRARQAHVGAALDREDDQLRDRLRHLRVRPLGEPRDPARRGAALHRRVPRALPARAGLHRAHDRAGGRATATSRRCSAGAGRCPRSARRTGRRAASASGSRSTSSCRARTRTSSRWR